MRRKVKIAAASTLMLALATGVALADSELWVQADKQSGRHVTQQGLDLKLPGRAEKQQASSSIDPASGRATTQAGTTASAGTQGTFTAKLTADGLNETLTFRYTEKNGRLSVLPSPDLGYTLHPLPDGRALVEYASSIYRLDPQKRTLSVFLKGQTGAVSQTSRHRSGKMVVWGQRASVSPDGTQLLYWTTRNLISTGNEDGENWIKDLRTGAEKRVYGVGYTLLGWDAKNRFYLDLGDSGIVQVDSASGSSAKLVSSFAVSAVSGNHLLSQSADGSLNIRNLTTGATQAFRGGGLNHLRSAAAFYTGEWFAVVNAPDRSSRVSTLMLINANTLESRTFAEPEGSSIIGISWADEDHLQVQTRNRSTAGESTYTIQTSEVVSE